MHNPRQKASFHVVNSTSHLSPLYSQPQNGSQKFFPDSALDPFPQLRLSLAVCITII